MQRLLSLFSAAIILLGVGTMSEAEAMDPENTLYMDTTHGRVVIELRPDLAPKHVARIKELTRDGFYDGLTGFASHLVAQGFVRPDHARLLMHAPEAPALLDLLENFVPSHTVKWLEREQAQKIVP